MKRLLVFISLLALVGSPSTAAPIDLGANLSYLRVLVLADSLEELGATIPTGRPMILDLRQVEANKESVTAFQDTLTRRAKGGTLFVLVSPDTPRDIAKVLSTAGSLLTLGVADSRPTPSVIVKTDAKADRRAYEALQTGTAITALISGKIEKERFDEATLVQEFRDGNVAAEPPPWSDPTAPKTAEPTPEKEAPVIDRVLQRAVNLHQALLALRRPGS